MAGNKELGTAKKALIQKIKRQISKQSFFRPSSETYKDKNLSNAIQLLQDSNENNDYKVRQLDAWINQIPELERVKSNTCRILREVKRMIEIEALAFKSSLEFEEKNLIRKIHNKRSKLLSQQHVSDSDKAIIKMLDDALILLLLDTSSSNALIEEKEVWMQLLIKKNEIRSKSSSYSNGEIDQLMNEMEKVVKFRWEVANAPATLLEMSKKVERMKEKVEKLTALPIELQEFPLPTNNETISVGDEVMFETTEINNGDELFETTEESSENEFVEVVFSLPISEDKQQLIDDITKQIAEVAPYAANKYYDKYAVLSTAKLALEGECSVAELKYAIIRHKPYKEALLGSQTKALVDRALRMLGSPEDSPAPSRPGSPSSNA